MGTLKNYISGALRNLVPIVQFKKREKHSSRGAFQFLKLYKWYQIAQRIT